MKISSKDLDKLVMQQAKNTIGYIEAKDKESFMVGVSVGKNL